MKKEIAIGALFCAMALTALINVRYLERLTRDVSESAAAVRYAADAEDWERAEKLASDTRDIWESGGAYTQLVLRHSSIEAAENSIAALLTAARARDQARVSGAADDVRRGMESLAETERVRLGSVF
ncbi:MAG: DUF4363 family protein [Oscillospiraceae bacterium]|jgi:hypothetical protein|nr:DUF4363 family protein [Oscillospiraceae bacterium]